MGIHVYQPQHQVMQDGRPDRIRRLNEGFAHLQITSLGEINRPYGASVDLPFNTEFACFMQALAEAGVGTSVPSLAGTDREYMAFEYEFIGNTTIKVTIPIHAGQVIPLFAQPYLTGGNLVMVFSGLTQQVLEHLS